MIAAEFSQLGFVEQSIVRMAMQEQHEWAFADPDKEEPCTIAGGVAASKWWFGCRVSKAAPIDGATTVATPSLAHETRRRRRWTS